MSNAIATKLQAAVRYAMVHGLTPISPLYVVNEYPKSGGTWVGQMVSRATGLPFPRNQFPALSTSMMHGHYLRPWGIENALVVWRDGRDMMVSWYHHTLFVNESGRNAPIVNELRSRLQFDDYHDVRSNLPAFIEQCFTQYRPMSFSWPQFVSEWCGRDDVTYVRYEDLRTNGPVELQRIVQALTGETITVNQAAEIVEEFSFARQAGRKPGQENKNSFLRKGIVGDWRNQFSPEACRVFDEYAGEALIKLGYELDHSWAGMAKSA